jgi:hypothetical protein
MKPNRKLAETKTPDGGCLVLHEHDGAYCIRLNASVIKPGGSALFWSARADPAFAQRLTQVGFKTKVVPAPLYTGAKRCAVNIYVADK